MSQKVEVTTISDLSGVAGAHNVKFAWDGTDLEIDLTEAERQAIVAVLPLTEARKLARTGKRGPGRPKGSTAAPIGAGLTKEDREDVRAFCEAVGKPLKARGRLPEVAITAWQQGKAEIWTAVA